MCAQNMSDYGAAIVTALSDSGASQPWRAASIAWQVARDATGPFEDGWRARHTASADVVARVNVITTGLHRDLGLAAGIEAAALTSRDDLPRLLAHLQRASNQLPTIATQAHATVGRWAAEGLLRAHGADLPRMEKMPEDRIRQIVAGQRVAVSRQDLQPLSAAITRAGSLSTALAAELNQASPGVPPAQPRLAAYYADRLATPHTAAQMTSDARHVEQALAATRSPLGAGQPHSRGYSPDR